MCLAQQKMELWQRSIQNRLRRDRCVASGEDFVGPAGRACVAPAVLCPALLTEDQLLQRDTASSSMEPREKVLMTYGPCLLMVPSVWCGSRDVGARMTWCFG